ncbi:LOW QUALITY PROTEIN: hypothetical protein PHMEG_0007925 [Phytophthora megakarya]|uniref:Uncharacterized protein n=1 Tax=Phytophthora megakarya TaxID=4795 RepID=A0A225WMD2_9STRA|nr:LOW QUALITY PROTEIN: hypothetical protein PHMEG_0007925 [Phytophthora megakarya]
MSSSSGSPHAIDPNESPRRSPNGSGDSLRDPSSDGFVHELGPDDFLPNGCAMCATGFESPSIPPSSAVNIPAVGDPVPSVDALVPDASALDHEAQVLRSRLELSTALNSGLATHALSRCESAREGYNLGLQAVDRLSSEVESHDHIICELRDDNQGVRDQAFQADTWRTQYNNLCKTTADEATPYQNALARANARISSLNSQLAAASVPAPPLASTSVSTATSQTSVTGDELSRFRADLTSAQASVQSKRTRVCSVTSERDSAHTESERRRVLCDVTAAELDDARDSLDRRRRELDVARAANQPLQDALRRVIATPARRRSHTRPGDVILGRRSSPCLGSSRSRLRPGQLIVSRAAIFRSVLVDARHSATQRREQTQERVRRLTARAAGLENALALSQQASQDEIALLGGLIDQSDLAAHDDLEPSATGSSRWSRVCTPGAHALVTQLSAMVTAVGGSLDVTQLLGEPGRGFDLRGHASSARPRPRDRTCSGHALRTPRVDTLSFDYSATAVPSSSAASTVDASTSTAGPASSSAQSDPATPNPSASASKTPAPPAVPVSTSA